MRFLLDQGVPQTTVDLLNARNMKAEHVSRLGMSRSGDEEILQHAHDMMVILPDITESIERGAAVTVTATRIRIRHLPINASDYQKS